MVPNERMRRFEHDLRYMRLNAAQYGGRITNPGLWFCDDVNYYLKVRKSAAAVGAAEHAEYSATIRNLICTPREHVRFHENGAARSVSATSQPIETSEGAIASWPTTWTCRCSVMRRTDAGALRLSTGSSLRG